MQDAEESTLILPQNIHSLIQIDSFIASHGLAGSQFYVAANGRGAWLGFRKHRVVKC